MLKAVQDYDSAKASLERGLSQPETAEKAGISVPYLSQLETNRRKGSLAVLSALAKVLKVSLDEMLSSQQ